jgi:hypothetical protein
MNPYLNGIMALSQLTPEQFDTGRQRFQQIQQMQPQGLSALQATQGPATGILQGPTSNLRGLYMGEVRDSSGNVVRPAINNQPASQPTITQATGGNPYYTQPTMTQANDAEGGFGTGANPYTQPYYQRQFGQGYQPATGYRTALYGQYRPMGGALFGQNMGSYSPYGMGGGKGGGYNPYGGYGYYGGYGPFGGQSGGKGGAI